MWNEFMVINTIIKDHDEINPRLVNNIYAFNDCWVLSYVVKPLFWEVFWCESSIYTLYTQNIKKVV